MMLRLHKGEFKPSLKEKEHVRVLNVIIFNESITHTLSNNVANANIDKPQRKTNRNTLI